MSVRFSSHSVAWPQSETTVQTPVRRGGQWSAGDTADNISHPANLQALEQHPPGRQRERGYSLSWSLNQSPGEVNRLVQKPLKLRSDPTQGSSDQKAGHLAATDAFHRLTRSPCQTHSSLASSPGASCPKDRPSLWPAKNKAFKTSLVALSSLFRSLFRALLARSSRSFLDFAFLGDFGFLGDILAPLRLR